MFHQLYVMYIHKALILTMPVMTALSVMQNTHLGSPTSPVRQSTSTRNAAPAPPMMVFCTIRPSAGPCPLA